MIGEEMIPPDLVPWIKLAVIVFAGLFAIPYIWIKLRGDKSTDREGREPPIPDKRLTGETEPRSNLPLYGPGKDYTSAAMMKEWEHPDQTWYREKLKRDAEGQPQ